MAQAVDCLQIKDELAPSTRAHYDAVRELSATIVEDRPLYGDLAAIEQYLKGKK
jgi:histidine ammonia-lyase